MTEAVVRTTRATYDEIAGAYYLRSQRGPNPVTGAALSRFRALLPDGALVADVGCGPGQHTAQLRQLGVKAIGVDLSAGMLRAGGQPDLVQADMRALPIRTAALDGIWSNAALLHLPRTLVPVALAEFARVVRVGAVLHLVVAEGDVEGFQTDAYDGQPRWYTYHAEDAMRARLAAAGFTVDSVSRHRTHRDWLTLGGTKLAPAG